jgi:NADPH-dependent F420 reductase
VDNTYFDYPVCVVPGTGRLGSGLALRLGWAGIPVVIGSRDPDRAGRAAAEAAGLVRGTFVGLPNREAAGRSEIVVLAVPPEAHTDVLEDICPWLRPGQVVVDTTVAFEGRSQPSPAERTRDAVPAGVDVVAALHTVAAGKLRDLQRRLREDVLLASDSAEANLRVAALIRRIPGLRPRRFTPLERARSFEEITALLIAFNRTEGTEAGVTFGDPDD